MSLSPQTYSQVQHSNSCFDRLKNNNINATSSHSSEEKFQIGNRNSSNNHHTGIPRYAIPYRRPTVLSCDPVCDQQTRTIFSPVNEIVGRSEVTRTCKFAESPQSTSDQLSIDSGSRREEQSSRRYCRNTARAKSVQPIDWYNRAISKDVSNGRDSGSEHSGPCSSTGRQRMISAKVGSFTNANHRPGGGNVRILDQKLDFNNTESKCNSKANLKYRPGGGDITIIDERLNFKETSRPKVNSLKNAKHAPGGGDVKIFNEKLPWLTYNRPKLPAEERSRINKRFNTEMSFSSRSQFSNDYT